MSTRNDKKEVETTGHSWDGIEEYNNPLPRWWVWIFYATIIWSIWYTAAYPSWPGMKDTVAGYLGFSTRGQVQAQIDAVNAANADMIAALEGADMATLADDQNLQGFAVNMGAAVFRANCSQCHGSGAGGAVGYPALLDDDWIWGGRIDEVVWTVTNGIRNEQSYDARGYGTNMPAFGDILSEEEISQAVNYVLSISGQEADAALATAGETVFLDNCAACHGDAATGSLANTRSMEDPENMYPDGEMTGAPNLTDAIWLFGGDEAAITETITNGRAGVMPAWAEEYRPGSGLTAAEINAVAAYVHQLGGGQ